MAAREQGIKCLPGLAQRKGVGDERLELTLGPQGPKTIYAKGSVEWEKQQQEERLARLALREPKEKRRLARVMFPVIEGTAK